MYYPNGAMEAEFKYSKDIAKEQKYFDEQGEPVSSEFGVGSRWVRRAHRF